MPSADDSPEAFRRGVQDQRSPTTPFTDSMRAAES